MVKYNSKLKAIIINEYITSKVGGAFLAKKYNLPVRIVSIWIQRFNLGGVSTLKRRKEKRIFSTEFKLNVIDYYQTHEESLTQVAIKFDILGSQISSLRSKFNRDGIEALKPLPKGRPSKVKKSKKKIHQFQNKSEVDALRAELAKKNQELYSKRLENDILKKSMTLFGPSKGDVKRK